MDNSFITAAVFRLEPRHNVLAVLLTGSAAYRRSIHPYDDFDVVVFTKNSPAQHTWYEIVRRLGKTFLLSIYFVPLNDLSPKTPNVLGQAGIEPLFGRKDILRYIFIENPRRTEPLPAKLPDFAKRQDRYLEIFVDCAFILKRYERRGLSNRTKPRLARKAMKNISRHFHEYNRSGMGPATARARWETVAKELASFLSKKVFSGRCDNPQLLKDFISLTQEDWNANRE
jgi:hypothetical protein